MAAQQKKKTALYFGSFNPIHIGHLAVLKYILSNCPECEVRLVVSPESPFKAGLMASSADRLEAARECMAENGLDVTVSDVEYHLEPPLYTIRTLLYLQENEPDREFILVMGADNIAGLHLWHESEKILSGFEIWVYPRNGYDGKALCARYNSFPETKGVRLLDAPTFDISSTGIRSGENREHNTGEDTDKLIQKALTLVEETRCILISRGAAMNTARIFREQFPEREPLVIADAAAARFAGFLGMNCNAHILPSDISDEWECALQLRDALNRTEAIPIALGPDAINDLTKLASHMCGKRYMAVATAVSTDFYASSKASITRSGTRRTLPCTAPQAIIADLDVLATAPASQLTVGYASLFSRIAEGADIILAEALGGGPTDETAFHIAQSGLHETIIDPESLTLRSPSALRRLTGGLLLGGLAMQLQTLHGGCATTHTHRTSIGTLVTLALYEQMMKCHPMSGEEHIPYDKLTAQLISPEEASRLLKAAGAPTEPEETGISRDRLRDSILEDSLIRQQFTIVDLALRTDRLEEWTKAIFGPGGLWPIK